MPIIAGQRLPVRIRVREPEKAKREAEIETRGGLKENLKDNHRESV